MLSNAIPARLYNRTATVMRRTAAPTGYGGTAAGVWQPVAGLNIPCRVTSQSARMRYKAAASGENISVDTLLLVTPYRTDLDDRVRFVVDGTNYDAQSINDPELMHHHLEFYVLRVN